MPHMDDNIMDYDASNYWDHATAQSPSQYASHHAPSSTLQPPTYCPPLPKRPSTPSYNDYASDTGNDWERSTLQSTSLSSPSTLQPPSNYPAPPKRIPSPSPYTDDTSSAAHYTRSPHRLTAYLIPFPTPSCKNTSGAPVPQRFLLYTPPPPPLSAPAQGEKEDRARKMQRKWQEEVRSATENPQKLASWRGVKGRVTKGVNTAMNWTTTSNVDFLNRIPPAHTTSAASPDLKTRGLEEMLLIYPSSLPGSPDQIRAEFLSNMLRTKSQAQRDAVIATGLLPVALATDLLIMFIWPFGGLFEVDGVWAMASIRGAKTARSVTKRLDSDEKGSGAAASPAGENEETLRLTFTPSERVEVLRRALAAECHRRDPKVFKALEGSAPADVEILEAIGWSSGLLRAESGKTGLGGETTHSEDEKWEMEQVKEDFRNQMHKGAKEWDKWIKEFEKDPEKALKK